MTHGDKKLECTASLTLVPFKCICIVLVAVLSMADLDNVLCKSLPPFNLFTFQTRL